MGDLPTEHKTWNLPLNDKYYDLDDDAKTFFKKETGIQEDEALRTHIIAVQRKAFSVGPLLHGVYACHIAEILHFYIYPYPCIRIFEFTR